LETSYRFLLPEMGRIDPMVDKAEFWKLARRTGVSVPDTHILRGSPDLETFLADCDCTCRWVVKPFQKSDAFEARFGKAQFLGSEKEWAVFADAYSEISVPTLVQTMIPGPDTNVLFCLVVFDDASQPVLTFCGRKIRQYKPVVGNTASAEPYRSADVLEQTVRFFERNGFIGMGSLEFKLHERDGRLYAIEPTVGRTNLQSEVAVINGVNLPAAYYWVCRALEKKLDGVLQKARESRRHRVWMRLGADCKSSWYYRRHKMLSLSEWLYPYTRKIELAVFRWTDPWPSLYEASRWLVSRAKRLAKFLIVGNVVM